MSATGSKQFVGCYQTETVKSEPFLPVPSASDFQVAVGKLKYIILQALISFQLNWFRQERKNCIRRHICLLI
jgi:hypothetical protein